MFVKIVARFYDLNVSNFSRIARARTGHGKSVNAASQARAHRVVNGMRSMVISLVLSAINHTLHPLIHPFTTAIRER